MQRSKYAPEFKDEAVKQVIDKGSSVVGVGSQRPQARRSLPGHALNRYFSTFLIKK